MQQQAASAVARQKEKSGQHFTQRNLPNSSRKDPNQASRRDAFMRKRTLQMEIIQPDHYAVNSADRNLESDYKQSLREGFDAKIDTASTQFGNNENYGPIISQDSTGKQHERPTHLNPQNKGSSNNQMPLVDSRLNESSQVQSHPQLVAMMQNNGSMQQLQNNSQISLLPAPQSNPPGSSGQIQKESIIKYVDSVAESKELLDTVNEIGRKEIQLKSKQNTQKNQKESAKINYQNSGKSLRQRTDSLGPSLNTNRQEMGLIHGEEIAIQADLMTPMHSQKTQNSIQQARKSIANNVKNLNKKASNTTLGLGVVPLSRDGIGPLQTLNQTGKIAVKTTENKNIIEKVPAEQIIPKTAIYESKDLKRVDPNEHPNFRIQQMTPSIDMQSTPTKIQDAEEEEYTGPVFPKQPTPKILQNLETFDNKKESVLQKNSFVRANKNYYLHQQKMLKKQEEAKKEMRRQRRAMVEQQKLLQTRIEQNRAHNDEQEQIRKQRLETNQNLKSEDQNQELQQQHLQKQFNATTESNFKVDRASALYFKEERSAVLRQTRNSNLHQKSQSDHGSPSPPQTYSTLQYPPPADLNITQKNEKKVVTQNFSPKGSPSNQKESMFSMLNNRLEPRLQHSGVGKGGEVGNFTIQPSPINKTPYKLDPNILMMQQSNEQMRLQPQPNSKGDDFIQNDIAVSNKFGGNNSKQNSAQNSAQNSLKNLHKPTKSVIQQGKQDKVAAYQNVKNSSAELYDVQEMVHKEASTGTFSTNTPHVDPKFDSHSIFKSSTSNNAVGKMVIRNEAVVNYQKRDTTTSQKVLLGQSSKDFHKKEARESERIINIVKRSQQSKDKLMVGGPDTVKAIDISKNSHLESKREQIIRDREQKKSKMTQMSQNSKVVKKTSIEDHALQNAINTAIIKGEGQTAGNTSEQAVKTATQQHVLQNEKNATEIVDTGVDEDQEDPSDEQKSKSDRLHTSDPSEINKLYTTPQGPEGMSPQFGKEGAGVDSDEIINISDPNTMFSKKDDPPLSKRSVHITQNLLPKTSKQQMGNQQNEPQNTNTSKDEGNQTLKVDFGMEESQANDFGFLVFQETNTGAKQLEYIQFNEKTNNNNSQPFNPATNNNDSSAQIKKNQQHFDQQPHHHMSNMPNNSNNWLMNLPLNNQTFQQIGSQKQLDTRGTSTEFMMTRFLEQSGSKINQQNMMASGVVEIGQPSGPARYYKHHQSMSDISRTLEYRTTMNSRFSQDQVVTLQPSSPSIKQEYEIGNGVGAEKADKNLQMSMSNISNNVGMKSQDSTGKEEAFDPSILSEALQKGLNLDEEMIGKLSLNELQLYKKDPETFLYIIILRKMGKNQFATATKPVNRQKIEFSATGEPEMNKNQTLDYVKLKADESKRILDLSMNPIVSRIDDEEALEMKKQRQMYRDYCIAQIDEALKGKDSLNSKEKRIIEKLHPIQKVVKQAAERKIEFMRDTKDFQMLTGTKMSADMLATSRLHMGLSTVDFKLREISKTQFVENDEELQKFEKLNGLNLTQSKENNSFKSPLFATLQTSIKNLGIGESNSSLMPTQNFKFQINQRAADGTANGIIQENSVLNETFINSQDGDQVMSPAGGSHSNNFPKTLNHPKMLNDGSGYLDPLHNLVGNDSRSPFLDKSQSVFEDNSAENSPKNNNIPATATQKSIFVNEQFHLPKMHNTSSFNDQQSQKDQPIRETSKILEPRNFRLSPMSPQDTSKEMNSYPTSRQSFLQAEKDAKELQRISKPLLTKDYFSSRSRFSAILSDPSVTYTKTFFKKEEDPYYKEILNRLKNPNHKKMEELDKGRIMLNRLRSKNTTVDTKTFETEVRKRKLDNMGIPCIPVTKMAPHQKNIYREMLSQKNAEKTEERVWQPMSLMLPILKESGVAKTSRATHPFNSKVQQAVDDKLADEDFIMNTEEITRLQIQKDLSSGFASSNRFNQRHLSVQPHSSAHLNLPLMHQTGYSSQSSMSKSPRRGKIKESYIQVGNFGRNGVDRDAKKALKLKKQQQMRNDRQENIRLIEERESKMKEEMDFLARMMADDEQESHLFVREEKSEKQVHHNNGKNQKSIMI